MKTCNVCGTRSETKTCADCSKVADLVALYNPDDLRLIVDGAYAGKHNERAACGAGLVLATAHDEAVIATCVCAFDANNSTQAELQAIVRGHRWAPGVSIWSDCDTQIVSAQRQGYPVHWLPVEWRDPLHNLAHRLAEVGMRRDWERYDRLWVPGAVW